MDSAMHLLFVVVLIVNNAYTQAYPPCDHSAHTEGGLVCGLRIRDGNGDPLISFLGIPYAKAPVGKLRFAEPQPPEPFVGYFNATVRGNVCPQPSNVTGVYLEPLSYGEDCLHVNIHVPLTALPDPGATQNDKPLTPVLFFVHGGSFMAGSGDPDSYGPEFLATKGIIIVTLNYRVGVFGFLSLNSKYIPGNAALRDILFALKWTKRNIKNFGGDPDQITLGGISGGATLAHLVALSPAVKGLGLFHRVFLMSGTAISEYYSSSPIYAKFISSMYLQRMGISELLPPKAIHQALINAPLRKILEAANQMYEKMSAYGIFTPVIETPFPKFTTIVPRDPYKLVDEGNSKEFPLLMSFTKDECESFRSISSRAVVKMMASPVTIIPPRLLFTANILSLPTIGQEIISEFFNGSRSLTDYFTDFCTYFYYQYPPFKIIEKRLATGAGPTYLWQFNYEPREMKHMLKVLLNMNYTGVAHTEDFGYIFRVNMAYDPPHTDEMTLPYTDVQMRNWLATMFANFVKTGRPTEDSSLWPPSGKRLEFLDIKEPYQYDFHPPPHEMIEKKHFYDNLVSMGRMKGFF